jgi:integrase
VTVTENKHKYRRQKSGLADRAFVELDGQRHYLGRYGTPESRQRYLRLLAEWSGGTLQPSGPLDELTVMELAARYWRYAKAYYVGPDGRPTIVHRVKQALKPVKQLYGTVPIDEFGPKSLRTVRQVWIKKGLARKTVCDYTDVVKRMVKWGVSHELVPPLVHHALSTVEGLRQGKSQAKETEPVRPVPEADIKAVRPFVSRQVWALIQLQLYTAARSGELLRMRAIDLDTAGKVWLYRLKDHKTAHRGRERIIYLGPCAQEIVKPFMADHPVDGYLFSPCEAEADRHARA